MMLASQLLDRLATAGKCIIFVLFPYFYCSDQSYSLFQIHNFKIILALIKFLVGYKAIPYTNIEVQYGTAQM